MSEKVSLERACDQLGEAVDSGNMGEIVAKHERMILGYYEDVKEQANKSFSVAKFAAIIGFVVIIFGLGYFLIFDALIRSGIIHPVASTAKSWAPILPMTISSMSLISGGLIEFISAVAFVLYARGAKQFGAFHICLERTHRYLLAFKIAQETGNERDKVLGSLVCIMANAPMISVDQQTRVGPESAAIPILPSALFRPDAGLVRASPAP